jgi:N-acetyl-anhydromuramoyl-L-alanine amidase
LTTPPAWLRGLPRWRSPNHNARLQGTVVDTVVIHNISLPPADFDERWVRAFFLNHLPAHRHPYFEHIATLRVSAHFYISRAGRVVQCVPLHRRAWHAGASQLMLEAGLRENLNHSSVGIELAGSDDVPYTTAQYQALRRLLLRLHAALALRYVVGHCDIAPLRKTDPGEQFDWQRLETSLPPSVRAGLRFRLE